MVAEARAGKHEFAAGWPKLATVGGDDDTIQAPPARRVETAGHL